MSRAEWVLPLVLLGACSLGTTATPDTTTPNVTVPTSAASSRTTASDGTGGGPVATDVPDPSAAFDWQDVGDGGRVQTGHLEVPMDYDDPSKGTFDLHIARHLADPDKRIGSLLVNPGGPGFGGSDWAVLAENNYDPVLVERFDIIGWDPRGTGLTTPAIDCIDDYDHYFAGVDITPDTPQERQLPIDLAKEYAAACVKRSGTFLPFVDTVSSARDMDTIRRALGEDTISYFGFSYGSELGATWATLFPSTVRAAALDGAVDPNADFLQRTLEQTAGFEQAITTFLARCSAQSDCAFHHGGNAEGGFDALMTSLDDTPIHTVAGRPDLTRAMALSAVGEAMYLESLWPVLATALAAAEKGDGSALLTLYDEYNRRQADGTWQNLLEAFQAIECQDNPERPTVAQEDASSAKYRAVAPRFAPATIGGYTCTFFPPSTASPLRITGKGAGPILVMGTTGDPATPLASTRKMADALEDGRLVIVTAEGHTGYFTNECTGSVIDDYLIDPVNKAPDDGFTCP
jgi:pimeloyl-ACP methyl ester carboxylesterase